MEISQDKLGLVFCRKAPFHIAGECIKGGFLTNQASDASFYFLRTQPLQNKLVERNGNHQRFPIKQNKVQAKNC